MIVATLAANVNLVGIYHTHNADHSEADLVFIVGLAGDVEWRMYCFVYDSDGGCGPPLILPAPDGVGRDDATAHLKNMLQMALAEEPGLQASLIITSSVKDAVEQIKAENWLLQIDIDDHDPDEPVDDAACLGDFAPWVREVKGAAVSMVAWRGFDRTEYGVQDVAYILARLPGQSWELHMRSRIIKNREVKVKTSTHCLDTCDEAKARDVLARWLSDDSSYSDPSSKPVVHISPLSNSFGEMGQDTNISYATLVRCISTMPWFKLASDLPDEEDP